MKVKRKIKKILKKKKLKKKQNAMNISRNGEIKR